MKKKQTKKQTKQTNSVVYGFQNIAQISLCAISF